MTKGELIDQLARRWAEHDEGDSGVDWSWNDSDMAEFRDAWRARATEFLPVIVDLVAEWLATDAAKNVMNGMDDDIIWMVADYWRERMT